MYTVLLPPGVKPIAVNKRIVSYSNYTVLYNVIGCTIGPFSLNIQRRHNAEEIDIFLRNLHVSTLHL